MSGAQGSDMLRLSISERMRLAALGADRSRRAAVARLLGSPMLRWRYGSAVADRLLIVPQELRNADPSLWHEIEFGQFGLAGTIAHIDDRSPFDIVPPSPAWERALHGFGWLRHLAAVDSGDARSMARQLAVEWSLRHGSGSGLAWEPAVSGRRIISWLSQAHVLLDGGDQESYDTLTESLGRQLVRLSSSWRDAPDGQPRLVALTALVLADLCVAGHDRQLEGAERAFGEELSRQILSDGGHVTRNPAVLVELMLDLLPLKQCFAARDRPIPPILASAMTRMLRMLRFMRLGDGRLARFNGMGVASPAALATVLAYGEGDVQLPVLSGPSRYVRLARGTTQVVADVGAPPPLQLAAEAHAGCLAIEVSVGKHLLLANGGAPGPWDLDWRAASRATASHSTLVLGEKSSSRLLRHARLETLAAGTPIRGPAHVQAGTGETDTEVAFDAAHDGYLDRLGLLHKRRVALSVDGLRIEGVDKLTPPRGALRLKQDVPFAIHFHLHPDVKCPAAGIDTATLVLPDGAVWSFTVAGAKLAVEESIHYADSSGPRRSLQLVARGTTPGETEVRWRIAASG
jgi:uncharacterized heparinase superfamily protein